MRINSVKSMCFNAPHYCIENRRRDEKKLQLQTVHTLWTWEKQTSWVLRSTKPSFRRKPRRGAVWKRSAQELAGSRSLRRGIHIGIRKFFHAHCIAIHAWPTVCKLTLSIASNQKVESVVWLLRYLSYLRIICMLELTVGSLKGTACVYESHKNFCPPACLESIDAPVSSRKTKMYQHLGGAYYRRQEYVL